MSELLQRFRERFQLWREKREGGAWGPPSGAKLGRNPLLWGLFGAVGVLLPPWHFRDALDVLLPASAVVFLVLYFAKSRFAWHVLAFDVLCIGPLYVFLSPSWRLQRLLHLGPDRRHMFPCRASFLVEGPILYLSSAAKASRGR